MSLYSDRMGPGRCAFSNPPAFRELRELQTRRM